MKAKPRRPRKPRPVPTQSMVYDGSRVMGVITPENGAFVARDAEERLLGIYATDRLAMVAICEHDEAARRTAAAE